MPVVDRALHVRQVQRTQLAQKRIVGVLHEEVAVVLETVEVRPRLGLIDVPEAVSSAAKHQRQVRVVGLRYGDRQIAGEQQSVRGCRAKVRPNPLLLCRVPWHDGPKQLAALSQERQARVTDARRQRCEVALRRRLSSGGGQVLRQFGLRQMPNCAFEVAQRLAVAVHERATATREKFAAEPLRTRPGGEVARRAHAAQVGGDDQLGNEILRDLREHVGSGCFLDRVTVEVGNVAFQCVGYLDLHEIFPRTV